MKLGLRIWVLIIVLSLTVLAINPSFEKGVQIKSVEKNSTAFDEGLRVGQIIKSVNGQRTDNAEDYSKIITELFSDEEDNQALETEVVEAGRENNKTKIKLTITTKKNNFIFFVDKPLEITVQDAPKTRIKTGLDLRGGARALIRPERKLSVQEMDDLISVSSNRLNVYGLSDIKIRAVKDMSGESFMLVEVAGATPPELRELISKQGKFEAKIGNESVFAGGERDISSVCRSDASCSGIETCSSSGGQEVCRFRFVIYLSEEAAEKHADITKNLGVNVTEFGRYLDEKLDLYLDDVLVDSLLISEDLKGRTTTQIQIQGSGVGPTRQDAIKEAEDSMHKLQTVLITGSLPYKLEIVKMDIISPLLGEKFSSAILYAGIAALVAVAIIIFIRYKKIKPSLALLFTSSSEIFIILGVAALINWNLDLPSIAGILATIGTSVDQHIIILDESRTKTLSMKQRLKRALFIVVSAYFTTVVALLPLYWAGAGLLKGFAVTTIIGITAGVLITRPAFAEIIKKIGD